MHVLRSVNRGAADVRVQEAGVKAPVPPLTRKFTVPVGFACVTGALLVSKPVSVTVTVQVLVGWPTVTVVSGQSSVVVVRWPAVTVVLPVSVSRLKKPLQATAPGEQSFTAEVMLMLARVSVWRPTIAPVGLKAASGKDASIDDVLPGRQTVTLQVCWARPAFTRGPPVWVTGSHVCT